MAVVVEKRSLGALGRMGIVAGMHVAVVLVVAKSLGLVPSMVTADPMITTFPDDPPVVDEPTKVTYNGDSLTTREVELVKPDDPATEADDEGALTGKLVRPEDVRTVGTVEPPRQNLVAVRQDPAHPLTQPPYPAPMIRGNNEGVVELEVFVQPDGRVSDARIVKSSGFEAFDRATLDEARRRWRLLPAMRDGVPYPQWARQRVVFRLVNR